MKRACSCSATELGAVMSFLPPPECSSPLGGAQLGARPHSVSIVQFSFLHPRDHAGYQLGDSGLLLLRKKIKILSNPHCRNGAGWEVNVTGCGTWHARAV